MKIANLEITFISLLGMLASTIFGIGSFIRYYIIYPDLDRMIAYLILSGVMFAISYIYNFMRHIDKRLDFIHNRLDTMWDLIGRNGK
jgi:hypothetical protein